MVSDRTDAKRFYSSQFSAKWALLYAVSKQALVMTLFLVGAGLTRQVLRQVGVRPLIMGVILWIVVSFATPVLIIGGYIR